MSEVVTCTPSSSRSNGARRRVMTSQRRPTCAAATRNLTGALSRETLLPERRLPVSVPFATTPLAGARKLVIFALIESLDNGAAVAGAGTPNAAAATSAASVMVWDRMPAGTRKPTPQVPSSRHPCPSDRSSRAQAEARTPARRRPRTGSDVWHAKPRRRVRRRARGTPVWSVQACQSGPTDGLRGCPRSRRTLNGGPPASSAPVGSVRGANQVREDRRNRHEESTCAEGRVDRAGVGESAPTADSGGAGRAGWGGEGGLA